MLPLLNDGSIYDISFIAKDLAGNESEAIIVSNVRFDISKPIITQIYPLENEFINSSEISFNTTEELIELKTNWSSIGKNSVISLIDSILKGENILESITNASLIDGDIYSLLIQGVDKALNISDSILIKNLTYDVKSPEFIVNFPKTNQYISSTDVEYNISEDLKSGQIIWESVDPVKDSRSPHIIELFNNELLADGVNGILNSIPLLADNTYYNISFNGVDKAMNKSSELLFNNILTDFKKPVLTIENPQSNTSINGGNIDFALSEDLNKGVVIWIPEGSTIDSPLSQIMHLDAGELKQGEHFGKEMIFPPTLENNKNYNIAFYGIDFADNYSDTIYVNNVLYDTINPIIIVNYPSNNQSINEFLPSYSLSENLNNAKIIVNRIEGNEDLDSPYFFDINSSDLKEGLNSNISLVGSDKLKNGTTYNINFYGEDFAGNSSDTVSIGNIDFDTENPIILILKPNSNEFIDNISMSYNLSEDLSSSIVKWINISDPNEVFTYTLNNQNLLLGDHLNIIMSDSLQLIDGSQYNVEISGFDLAGNKADNVFLNNVGYDLSPPVLTISSPKDSSFINNPFIIYGLSENLDSAQITWVNNMTNESTIVQLNGNDLTRGIHEDFVDPDMNSLVSGDIYSLIIEGKDLAGNNSNKFIVNHVNFDNILPNATINFPNSSDFINSNLFSYNLDEDFNNAQIKIEHTDGLIDPSSPYTIELESNELLKGEYNDIYFVNSFSLNDGSIYNFTFNGFDKAGNKSNEIIINDITYDITSPTIEIDFP